MVGNLAEGTLNAVASINVANNKCNSIGAHLAKLEESVQTLITKVEWLEYHNQRNHNNYDKGTRPAAESKAIQNIKVLASDKTGFRLWNNKFINAIT